MNSTRHSTLSRNRDDELVEEIASLILIVARHADDETVLAAEGASMAIISRTLKAVVDGELDEVLEVVGRGEFVRNSLGLIEASWNRPPTEPLAIKEPWHRFIALSPIGTGEEE